LRLFFKLNVMKQENIKTLTWSFESHVNELDNWVEFWLARDLQHLLWYSKWDNFMNVISKAKTATEISWWDISNHFADTGKTIKMPKGAQKEISDIMLTRYACYLVAMNADSSKEEIAFAQQYFAVQTRKYEIIEQRILEYERVVARKKLKETEKELSEIIYEQTWNDKNFWIIRSKWDKALFWKTTKEMKNVWDIKWTKPLADFMPTILLKAKDFATEITIYNAKEKEMKTENEISNEHITNNRTVRKTLKERWITPEKLNPEEDLSKVERKLNSQTKKWLKSNDWFQK